MSLKISAESSIVADNAGRFAAGCRLQQRCAIAVCGYIERKSSESVRRVRAGGGAGRGDPGGSSRDAREVDRRSRRHDRTARGPRADDVFEDDFFIDQGTPRGLIPDTFKMFEDDLNKRLENKHLRVQIVYVPVAHDDLFPALVEGRGNIV